MFLDLILSIVFSVFIIRDILFPLDIRKMIDQTISSNALLKGIEQMYKKATESKRLFSTVENDAEKCCDSPTQLRKKASLYEENDCPSPVERSPSSIRSESNSPQYEKTPYLPEEVCNKRSVPFSEPKL